MQKTLPYFETSFTTYLPGLLLTLFIAILAFYLASWEVASQLGLSAMTFAIILGMLVGNTFYPSIESIVHSGIALSKGKILRLGIILYGFKLTLNEVWSLGFNTLLTDVLMLCSTFAISYFIGYKLLKIDQKTVVLTGAGCSICGAAAVLATSPVCRAKPSDVTQAIAIVVLYGTLAIFLYPWLYQWLGQYYGLEKFGVIIGSSVHEVAQVVAIGEQVGGQAADISVLTKMVRVILLAPFLIVMAYAFRQVSAKTKEKSPVTKTTEAPTEYKKNNIQIPWFAIIFILMIVLNSIITLPNALHEKINFFDNLLLMMAMAGLGLTTHLSVFKQAGPKPLLLGALVFIWLIISSFALQLIL